MTFRTLIRIGFASVALTALAAGSADAQIYTWRDARGQLVLSNHRQNETPDPERSLAVANTQDVRATRYVPQELSRAFDELIVENARLQGLRPDLVRAVVQVESGFNPYAESPKGARGLMQLMPATAREFGVVNPFDPRENIRAGAAYLRQLLDRYDDSETLALAAYNAGPGAVDRHGQAVPPYQETQKYVAKVNDLAGAAAKPVKETVPGTHIYKIVEVVNGRTVVRYTDEKPK